MIVCHCNCIEHNAIESACDTLAAGDGPRPLAPAVVYKALGRRVRCGGCLPLAAYIIQERTGSNHGLAQRCPLVDSCDRVACSMGEVPDLDVAALIATSVSTAGERA